MRCSEAVNMGRLAGVFALAGVACALEAGIGAAIAFFAGTLAFPGACPAGLTGALTGALTVFAALALDAPDAALPAAFLVGVGAAFIWGRSLAFFSGLDMRRLKY